MAEREARHGGGVPADPRGVLRKGRAFLDLFWDIAKPEQEVRLAATENLLRHLRDGGEVRRGAAAGGRRGCDPAGVCAGRPCHRLALFQDEELKYALRRLVEGLGATREAARPGFSLALAQVSALESRYLFPQRIVRIFSSGSVYIAFKSC